MIIHYTAQTELAASTTLPFAPPGSTSEVGQFWWLRQEWQVLGPPTMPAPAATDHQSWSRMAGRVRPCPTFPRNLREEPYSQWRLSLVHWVWDMRTMAICESLLSAPFKEALKGGDSGVHESAIFIDPRIMSSPGRPAGTNGRMSQYGPQA